MKNILYIHGAGASHKSFNWIVEKLPEHNPSFFSYDLNTTFTTCLETMNNRLDIIGEPTIVIGHSLGGLLAAGLCANQHVTKIVTISAPLSGILAAGLWGIMSLKPMLSDLLPYSTILYDIKTMNSRSKKPHKAFVSTHGMPISIEANDGVVFVSSQMAWETPQYSKYDLNHFEILMDHDVIQEIQNFIE